MESVTKTGQADPSGLNTASIFKGMQPVGLSIKLKVAPKISEERYIKLH